MADDVRSQLGLICMIECSGCTFIPALPGEAQHSETHCQISFDHVHVDFRTMFIPLRGLKHSSRQKRRKADDSEFGIYCLTGAVISIPRPST